MQANFGGRDGRFAASRRIETALSPLNCDHTYDDAPGLSR